MHILFPDWLSCCNFSKAWRANLNAPKAFPCLANVYNIELKQTHQELLSKKIGKIVGIVVKLLIYTYFSI